MRGGLAALDGLESRSVSLALPSFGLFAGIGGIEAGLAQAGHCTASFFETDPAACAVLRNRFPEAHVAGDVAGLNDVPSHVRLLTAGFPCQNISMAGDKAGINGEKSGVVDHVFELLERRRVPWLLFENVYFLLYVKQGRSLAYLLDRIERLGYRWAYRIVNSYWFGLPQRRRRLFLIASTEGDPRDVLLADDAPIPEKPERTLERPLGFYWTEGRSGVGFAVDALPPLKGGSSIGIPSPPAVLFPDGRVAKPSITTAELAQGLAAGWTAPAEETSRRSARWRLVGNAVSVPVAEWIGHRLARPGNYDASIDRPLTEDDPWPKSAWGEYGRRHQSHASERPLDKGIPSLDCLMEYDWLPLSKKATDGFVSRAESSNLRFPEGFLAALRRHAELAD